MNIKNSRCEVCGQLGHGQHFGVVSCRACAAFFRRAANSKWSTTQCLSKFCDGKTYHCKPCRLKKCREVGMDTKNFQHGRDQVQIYSNVFSRKRKLPQTIEIVCGKPHFVLFQPHSKQPNTYVDMSLLVSTAMDIFKRGVQKPWVAKNGLLKLGYGSNCMKRTEDREKVTIVSRKEITSFWEHHVLTTAKWLTNFDKFEGLEQDMKMEILMAVWHVWGRLDKLMATALRLGRSSDVKQTERVIGNGVVADTCHIVADSSWMSRYPTEQLRFFLDGMRGFDLHHLIEELQNLGLTEIEFTFMLAHLCFQYAASRLGGTTAEIMEGFVEELTNDLHNYYVQEQMMSRYSGRLMKMLRINREILENIREYRGRGEVAKVFGVFNFDFSHPEMFRDTGLM